MTDFGKLGILIKNDGTRTINWAMSTTHGLERMAERGVTRAMAESWVSTGKALRQYGGQILFVTQEGAVVVNPVGKVLIAYTYEYFDGTMTVIVELLFGR